LRTTRPRMCPTSARSAYMKGVPGGAPLSCFRLPCRRSVVDRRHCLLDLVSFRFRGLTGEFHFLIPEDAGTGRDQVADDDVLLETDEVVPGTPDGRIGEHP